MAYKLNKKLENMTPYSPSIGEYRLKMDANESYVKPLDELSGLINLATSQVTLNRYPDPTAERMCGFFAELNGISPELVTAGNGSDELISVICNSFMQKGERAMIVPPDFSMYEFYLTLAECEVEKCPKNEDFTVDIDRLIDETNKKQCRMLIFSNPCNPTSLGIEAPDVRRIIEGVPDTLVVLDEAYMDFWDQSLIKETENYDNLIVLRTCSKMLGLAALRVGFAVTNKKLTALIRTCKSPYNVNSMSQAAASALLAHSEMVEKLRRKLVIARNELYLMLKDVAVSYDAEVFPTCTNFVTVKTPDARKIYEELKKRSIIVRCFDGYLRITAGNRVDNRELLEQLMIIFKQIKSGEI